MTNLPPLEHLPSLPPLEMGRPIETVPLGHETFETPMINLSGIKKDAGSIPSSIDDQTWFDERIELPVRSSVQRLMRAGALTYESGANTDNVGEPFNGNPSSISISLSRSINGNNLKEQAQKIMAEMQARGVSAEEAGYSFDFYTDPRAKDTGELLTINVAVSDTDTVAQVSDKFNALTGLLLGDTQMVQEWAPPSIETKGTVEAFSFADSLLSDDAMDREVAAINEELSTEKLQEQARIADKITELSKQFTHDNVHTDGKINNEIKALDNQARQDETSYRRFHNLATRKFELEKHNRRELSHSDTRAQILLSAIEEAAKKQSDLGEAPFSKFKENNREAWLHVPDAAVRDYMRSRLYVDTGHIGNDVNRLEIQANDGETINIPTNIFVHAAGFTSWEGNPYSSVTTQSEYGNNSGNSFNAMKHYASLPTEIPAINSVNVYIQPDGKVFADNGSGGSHRVGASILRGEESIKTGRVTIRKLSRNYI